MAITPGVSFSPISSERTLEDLPALLARLFGGPSEGTGVRRLPRLIGRGVLPDEILKQFLTQLPQGDVTRPDITEVFAPEQPAIVERPGAPLPGAQPVQTAPPDLFAGPISEPAPESSPAAEPTPEDLFPGSVGGQPGFGVEGEAGAGGPDFPNIYAGEPGQEPAKGEPIYNAPGPADFGAPTGTSEESSGGGPGGMTPEEFIELLTGGGFSIR